jgi:hypothetical protein
LIEKNLAQLNPDFIEFVGYLFQRQISAFLIIFGRRGTGKTDFALLICQILNHIGLVKHFATNLKVSGNNIVIEQITNLDDLRLWARENQGRKLFLWDELGKSANRRKPMAALTVKIIEDMQTLRKFKLSVLGTTIDEEYIDRAVLSPQLLDGIFTKDHFDDPKKAQYEDYLLGFNEPITGIPATSLRFDTYASPPFAEHGKNQKPKFKDHDLEVLWNWSHGSTYKQLGIHPQQLNRISRKFVQEMLERTFHSSQPLECEDIDNGVLCDEAAKTP